VHGRAQPLANHGLETIAALVGGADVLCEQPESLDAGGARPLQRVLSGRVHVAHVSLPRHLLGVAARNSGQLRRRLELDQVMIAAHLIDAVEGLGLGPGERLERAGTGAHDEPEAEQQGQRGAEPGLGHQEPDPLGVLWRSDSESTSRRTSFPPS
jgi:hypothetical protein